MKIALLNLQYDNNYGGNLQRYAMMTVLKRMGHDVTHLNLRFNYNPEPLHKHPIKLIKKIRRKLFFDRNLDLFREYRAQREYEKSCSVTDSFYNKYIKHTSVIGHKEDLSKHTEYDVYLVGSDQVWRKMIAKIYGINTFFFDFLPLNNRIKRVAYGVSLGTSENELTETELEELTPLYNQFDAVSVREDSALNLFMQYRWTNPEAIHVLDPTLLLTKEDYIDLINDGSTVKSKGNMFCYILDPSEEKEAIINEYENKYHLKSFRSGLNDNEEMSVQQWLRSFYESEFIVTDSFHGVVFSIIFNKPFKLILNSFRGNARFESLMRQLNIPEHTENIEWNEINNRIKDWNNISISFLHNSL